MKVLVTGGAGFIGAEVINQLLAGGHEVANVDCFTYAAADGSRLTKARQHRNYVECKSGVTNEPALSAIFQNHQPELMIHLAAETHVDRSIDDSTEFVETNVAGTQLLLELTQEFIPEQKEPVFCYVSTDEVYGPWDFETHGDEGFREEDKLNPRNPYSATKAAAEHLTMAYYHTHGLPVTITRGSNTFGPMQMPEKFLPMMILRALNDERLPIYGDGLQTREWLHVADHARGIIQVAMYGKPGNAYNLGPGECETNLVVARLILERTGKPESLIEFVTDRPGHDRDYAIFPGKAQRDFDWIPEKPFISATDPKHDGLNDMIGWYFGEGAAWCKALGQEHLERKGLG